MVEVKNIAKRINFALTNITKDMEDWELDFEWLQVRHWIKDNFKYEKLPDLNAILLLIGVRELGQVKKQFSKEEKQDLMHIAVCQLLSDEGYYEFEGNDEEGWPHWRQVAGVQTKGLEAQERLLKVKVVKYFKAL